MKLYMESVRDVRSQKPLRPILWSLFLGILQTGMKKWEKFFFVQILTLNTVWKLIENLTKNNERAGSENGLVTIVRVTIVQRF